MDFLSWVWTVTQESGPVITVLLIVVIYTRDRLWTERHDRLCVRISANVEEIEKVAKELKETDGRLGAVDRDVATLVSTTGEIKATLEKHDNDERGFWADMRKFMLHQGFRNEDERG
jgi:hypothetical protein